MTEAPIGVDPAVPNVARMYDYYLGGKNNYAADRAAADRIVSLMPDARRWVRENRLFLARTVSYLAGIGVRQFIDIGAGLPTQNSVHEVAPGSRVVYVDNDPVVLAHARALLENETEIVAVQADMRQPASIFDDPKTQALIDLDQPVAVLLLAVLHFIPDDSEAASIVTQLCGRLGAGSYLVVSHAMPGDVRSDVVDEGRQVYAASSAGSITPRPPDQLTCLFAGLELVPPGPGQRHPLGTRRRGRAQQLPPGLRRRHRPQTLLARPRDVDGDRSRSCSPISQSSLVAGQYDRFPVFFGALVQVVVDWPPVPRCRQLG